MSSVETQFECEEQRKLISELQARLADAEFKVIEGEKLRKKLHNTILVSHFFSVSFEFIVQFQHPFLKMILYIHQMMCTGIERKYPSILQSSTSPS